MKRKFRIYIFFATWLFCAIVAAILNGLNMQWSTFDIPSGISVLILISIIQGSVLEIPLQVIATLIMGGQTRRHKIGNGNKFKLIINYNLLAHSTDDVDECFKNMYEGYMGNIRPNISAVLVSATKNESLKQYEIYMRDVYRGILFDELYAEGLEFSKGSLDRVDPLRLKYIWNKYNQVRSESFVENFLFNICRVFSEEFMLIHRESSVLRKCGQYQDLMLLSDGITNGYSYCDKALYNSLARHETEMFKWNDDVENIKGRSYDFTLVLDADSRLQAGTVFELLNIAAAYPERGIIQPFIEIECHGNDPLYMHLETTRQNIYKPMMNAVNSVFGQCSFCGKGLVRNKSYIETIIGTEENLIERVPIDVLSHDTYEATILKPLFVATVSLKEQPPFNYVSWNIRERRWNRGEILNSMYFWRYAVGVPLRWLQQIFQRKQFVLTKHRTKAKLDIVSSYIAHAPIRQMIMKPLLLIYILVHVNINLHFKYVPLIIVMFLIVVFPKIAVCTRKNYKAVFIETFASIMQFTPEAVVGSVRILRSFQANICTKIKWIPSRQIEKEFRDSNPFLKSFLHLWGYSFFAVLMSIAVYFIRPDAVLAYFMLATVFLLPVFSGITSCRPSGFRRKCRSCKRPCSSNRVHTYQPKQSAKKSRILHVWTTDIELQTTTSSA